MSAPSPADELRQAAARLSTYPVMDDRYAVPLAALLEVEAASAAGDEDHAHCTAQTCTTIAALAVARQILGEEAGHVS